MPQSSIDHSEVEIVVNHVMSNGLKSGIFDDFIGYLEKASSGQKHITTLTPLPDADVYHYHRPHLEQRLLPKSIVTVHHDPNDNDPWLDFSKFAKPYHDAEKIVCLNTLQRDWLMQRGYIKTDVIPHGFNQKFLKVSNDKKFPKFTIGMASKRYGRRVKGESLLMEMAKRLPSEQFEFVLVGAGRTHEAWLLEQLGFAVRVYERLPYRLFQKFYDSIDALMVLSWHEGGPACIPEAIATATPVITTRVGMAVDYVFEGQNGIYLDRDPEKDAKKILALSNDVKLRRQIADGAKKAVGSIPTWEQVAESYKIIYLEVSNL